MNLLERANRDGRNYRKASSINGGEYHGPCPVCGGTDRFHIWPAQGDHGTFWCRSCGIGGDAIEYLVKIEGLHFRDACKEVGKELPENEEYQAPRFRRPAAADTFQPRVIAAPADLWIQHAEKFVQWSHEQLLATPAQIHYLAGRGIDSNHLKTDRYAIGWNPGEKDKNLFRSREAWGLETELKEDGAKKKLCLPIGLVIAKYSEGVLRSIRIRIPNELRRGPKPLPYILVKGSATDTFITRTDAKAWLIVEAELDAIAIDCAAGDLVGAMAMGNNSAKPTEVAHQLLVNAMWIGNALDYDPKTNDQGAAKNSGGDQWPWWQQHYPQAERWPVPAGKDPGDAYKAGIDLRAWVVAGLPPILTLPPPPIPAAEPPRQDIPAAGAAAASPQQTGEVAVPVPEACNHQTIVTATGRTIAVTDNRATYAELATQGIAVFTSREIHMVRGAGISRERAELLIDAKECFPGCWISRVEKLEEVSQ